MKTCETCKWWVAPETKGLPSFMEPSKFGVCLNPMNDKLNYNLSAGGVVRMATQSMAKGMCGLHELKL